MKLSIDHWLGFAVGIALCAVLYFAVGSASAQSGATSGSASNVNVNVASISNNAATAQPNKTKFKNSGTTSINSVGVTSGPAIFGGGHPCLSGKSGSVGVLGGAVGYGQGDAEPICMLKLLGQDEAALRLLAATNNGACKALVQSGAINSDCGGSIKNTATVAAVKTPGASWKKCDFDAAANKITWRPKGDKVASKAACLSHLGF